MIYICQDCGFFFRRYGAVEQCPQCERKHIRQATIEEAALVQLTLDKPPIYNHKEEDKR